LGKNFPRNFPRNFPQKKITKNWPLQVSLEFRAFLRRRLEVSGVSDVSKQVKTFVEKVNRAAANLPQAPAAGHDSIDDLTALVQVTEAPFLLLTRG
jgi:hypothetical protein